MSNLKFGDIFQHLTDKFGIPYGDGDESSNESDESDVNVVDFHKEQHQQSEQQLEQKKNKEVLQEHPIYHNLTLRDQHQENELEILVPPQEHSKNSKHIKRKYNQTTTTIKDK